MNKALFCESCDMEFKVKHDADDDIYRPLYCPFCGIELEKEEEYDCEDDDE